MIIKVKWTRRVGAAVVGVALAVILVIVVRSRQPDAAWTPSGDTSDTYIQLLGQMAQTWDAFDPMAPPTFLEVDSLPALNLDSNQPQTKSN